MTYPSMYREPETERFMIMAFIATVFHLFLIYGVAFTLPKGDKPLNTTMDIILVQKSSEEAPDKPDYLAQATQNGGGEGEKDERPATPSIAPFPDNTTNVVANPPLPQTALSPDQPQVEQLTTPHPAEHQVAQSEQVVSPNETPSQPDAGEDLQTTEAAPEIPSVTLIAEAQLAIASTQAVLDEQFLAQAKRPRKKYISARTKEYKYAPYMESWRRKVERVGNNKYREIARSKKLTGQLILDVAINYDGTINEIEVMSSSGHKILDDAAIQSVRLAAPFDAFPDSFRQEFDVIHITRTWKYTFGGSVITKDPASR